MSANALQVMTIRTPEGTSFSLPLAGPVSRTLAFLIDLVVLGVTALVFAFVMIIFAATMPYGQDNAGMLLSIGMFALWFCYGIVLEWFWRGRTVGKRVLRLRVVDQSGLNLRFSQVVMRNLIRSVDMLPLGLIGGVSCVLTRRCQRLGDLAANTVVIRVPQVSAVDLSAVRLMQENSFRACPHLEGRLRQKVSPAMAAVALDALQRRNRMDDGPRLELFASLAGHFRELVAFPENLTEGLSDEAYVRNVVETLYRNQAGGR